MTPNKPTLGRCTSLLPALTTALAAVGLVSTAQAQLQVAGSLLINVDATVAPLGTLPSITNNGTMGGVFEARGGAAETPVVARVSGIGTKGILLDGNDYLMHVNMVGGVPVPADPSLTGANPTCTIEAWVLNPGLAQEETIVSWGHRGGGDGQNMSFNYGWDAAWGAIGHWGGSDIGWDPSSAAAGVNPPGNPKSGVWHHLVYTFDGTTQRIYADGVEKNTELISLNTYPVPPVVIGAQMVTDTAVEPALRGTMTIARVRVHSEALSGAQVSGNYNFERNDFIDIGSPLPFGPSHRYSFNSPAGAVTNGTIVSNSVGPAHGIVRGAGANFTGGRLSLPGGANTTAPFVDLPNGLVSGNSTNRGGVGGVTMEGWIKITGSRTWSRIFDFGSTDIDPTTNIIGGEVSNIGGGGEGLDYLFLSAQEDNNVNRHVMDIRNFDGLPTTDPGGPGYDSGNFNRDFHYALSWDEASGQVIVYENGAAVTSFSAGTTAMSDLNDVNCWLGRSNWPDQNTQAEYDEFRVYPRVVPPEQIRASFVAGPDALATADPVSITLDPQNQTGPEFGSASFTVAAGGALPIGYQWFTNGTAVAGQVGTSLTLNNLAPGQSGLQIRAVASNNIGGNSFYATSQVAILTVLADTNPPTIVQTRANSATTIEVIFSEAVNSADLANPANFALSGPAGTPSITAAAAGGNRRAILTLSGPLTACEFYTVGVTGVNDLSAAANETPVGTQATFWYFTGGTGLAHRYTFNNTSGNAAGATVPDVVGTANGTVLTGGGATTFTGDRLTLSGGGSATAPYVDLPNGLLSVNSTNNAGSGQVTLEGWVKVTGGRTWSRIFDFGSVGFNELNGPGGAGNGERYLMLSAQIGNDVNNLRFEMTGASGFAGGFTRDFATTFNQDMHFAMTWDETTGQIRMYRNGVMTVQVTSTATMTNVQDVNVWLGRSNWTGDQNMQGEFDEFRIYNRTLSQADVQLNFAGGPDNNYGALLGLNLTVVTNNVVTNTVSNVRVLASFSNAGTQDLASAGCVVYSSTDSNVVYITSDGVLHALGVGTATISATLGGITDSEIIEVSEDAIPPGLVSARAVSLNSIEILYTEPVDLGTSEEASNYTVTSPSGTLTVLSVTRSLDQRRVVVQLANPLPCEYITISVSFVADQSPLFNQIPENSQVGFTYYVLPNLKHRYTFNNAASATAAGTIVPDLINPGPGDGIVLGAPASFSGGRVVLGGGGSGVAGYVDLPNGLLSTNSVNRGGSGQVTFEGWTRVTGSVGWSRILDFGSTVGGEVTGPGGGGEGLDYLFYAAQEGGNVNRHVIDVRNHDPVLTPPAPDPAGPGYDTPTFGQDFHFALTWNEATGLIAVYENGVQMASFSAGIPMSQINDVNVWLGRSNWTQDGNMQGEFDEFRVYDRVLSTGEMALSRALGPDITLGQPLALNVTQTNHVQIGSLLRPTSWVSFSSFSNLNVTASGCVVLSSDNQSVLATNGAGLHAIGLGMANLTAIFSGITNTIPITVGYQLTFTGLTPSQSYNVQVAPEVTGPWSNIGTVSATAEGTISFEDITPRGPQAFYRARLVP